MQRRRFSVNPEVNLTPLIDTALTLLVIFILTAPMVHHAIKIDLPKSAYQQGAKDSQDLVVAIDEKGVIFFNGNPVSLAQLGKAIKQYLASSGLQEKTVLLKVHGDTTTCSTLVAIIDNINGIGGIKDVKIDTKKIATTV